MHDLHQSVIRILNVKGQTLGAGFVISDHLAVTCAHVVNDVGSNYDQPIQIQFFSNEHQQTALVLKAGWSPRDADDVAFLQLEQLPPGVVPVVLGSAEKCNEDSYRTFGFARLAGYDTRWASGTLDGVVFVPDKHKQSMLQLKGDEIKGGMSGAPVLDTKTNRVVGMVSEYKDDDHSRIAWATTSDTLLNLASPLLQEHPTLRLWPAAYGPAEQKQYLQYLITSNEMLILPDGRDVLLERIYVSLRADEMNAAERQAEHNLYLKDVAALKALVNGSGEDQYAEDDAIRRTISHRPIMPSLQARNRPRQSDEREHRLLSLAEVVKSNRYVVILGDPGSGKTTLGKWLVLQYARALLQGKLQVQVQADQVQPGSRTDQSINLGPARLPVLIRIADYAHQLDKKRGGDKLPIENFISFRWNDHDGPYDLPLGLAANTINAMLKDYLLQGRTLVVLDGLDEVGNPKQRRAVMQAVKSFIQTQPATQAKNNEWLGNRLLLTSRIVGYQFDPLTDLPHYTVEDMDEKAISAFCRAWMAHVVEAKEAEKQGKQLKDAIFKHAHPGVRTLAGNPLLLTILAQVYSASHSLPPWRVKLFDSAVEALYDQRRDIWEQAGISLRRLTQALGSVAAHIHTYEKNGFAEGGTIRAQLMEVLADWDQAEEVLKAARQVSGFLVERGEGVYGFLHRAIQEYFAAKHLANDPLQLKTRLAEHILDPTWREPITLAVGVVSQHRYPNSERHLVEAFNTLLDTPDPAGDFLPRRELLAVAACIECERLPPQIGRSIADRLLILYTRREGGRRSPVLRKRIHDAFITLLHQSETREQAEAALCDALLHPAFELRYAAIDTVIGTEWTSTAIAQALVKSWSQYADPAVSLLTALDDVRQRSPACFKLEFLPMRQAVTANPKLWETASISLQWKAILRVLYLPLGAYFRSDRINRDSPLTPLLLELLQRPKPLDPSVFAELQQRLIPLTSQSGSAQARDAALALSALGDGTWIQPCIKQADDQGHEIHPIVACLVLALSLELALDTNHMLSNDLDRTLKQAITLAHTFSQLCTDINEHTQALQEIKTDIQRVEPLASEGIAQINNYITALLNEPALADTHTYKLAGDLHKLLELAIQQIHEHTSTSSRASELDLASKTKLIADLHRELGLLSPLYQTFLSNREIANIHTASSQRKNAKQKQNPEVDLRNKSHRINTMASALGIFLPLDIEQVYLLATRFINRKKNQVQGFLDTQKLLTAIEPIDDLTPWELSKIINGLVSLLGPTFPLNTQELRKILDQLKYMIDTTTHSKEDHAACSDDQHTMLPIALTNPSQFELAGSLRYDLSRLFDLNYANVRETLEQTNGEPDPALTSVVEKIRTLIMQINVAAYKLGLVLPVDWPRAHKLIQQYLSNRRYKYEQDVQQLELGNQLLSVLNDITELKQQRNHKFTTSRISPDPLVRAKAYEQAKEYEDKLASANAQAYTYATDLGCPFFDIESALELVRKEERNLAHSHTEALNQLRLLEIDFARTLTQAQDLLNELEFAISQELPSRQPTGKLSPSRDFAQAQELIQLRANTRETNDKITFSRTLLRKHAKEFFEVLSAAEEQAYKLRQQFERALRSDRELSSEIDLDNVRRLDLTPDLDFAFDLARPSAHVNELLHSIAQWQNIVNNDDEAKQHLKKALTSAQNVQKVFATSTPIAQVVSTLIETYRKRWPTAASSSTIAPEQVQLSFDKVRDMIDDLTSPNDDRRERAKEMLVAKHSASELGQTVIEKIAIFIDQHARDPQIVTQLTWTLDAIIHDQPCWMAEWIAQMTMLPHKKQVQTILDSVHHVTAKTCETILDALPDPDPQVNKSLLNSLSWQMRLKQVPRGKLPMLRTSLFSWLAKEEDPTIRRSIIKTLGHWREDSDSVGLALLDQLNQLTMKWDLPALYQALARSDLPALYQALACQAAQRPDLSALYQALARQAAQRSNIEEKVRDKLRGACFDSALYQALVRQAEQQPNIEEKIREKLRGACFNADAAASLIRLTVTKNKETTDLNKTELSTPRMRRKIGAQRKASLQALRSLLAAAEDDPAEKPKSAANKQRDLDNTLNMLSRISSSRSHCLQALLKAGVDDDIWDDEYHGVLVKAYHGMLEKIAEEAIQEQRDPQINLSLVKELLTDLLTQFEDALASRNWPLRRFILAIVATCTETMAAAVQDACPGNLEMLLVRATTDAESFNSRRFALTALSYLRTITPAVIPALLAGCHDTEDVQQDTITATSHFQSIEGNLLPVLMEEISGESVSRAYTVAQLLSALGSSAAAETSELRHQIIEAVVEGLKDERSQREVLISGNDKGKLEDALYTTLLRVAGWMG